MKRCALLVFAVFFLSLGTLFADDIPHDPIIDIERGTGTIGFGDNGFSFTITDNANSCVSFSDGIDSCSGATPDTLGNLTGQDITSLDFLLTPSSPVVETEGIFSAAEGSPFNVVNQLSGFEAIYSGTGPDAVITHNCTETEDRVTCDPNSEIKTSEFTVGLAQVLVPVGGSTVVAIRSVSTVPEPPAAALVLTGIGIIGVVRRWFWKA